MNFLKEVLVLMAWAGAIAPAWALVGPHLRAGDPDSPPQAIRAAPDHAPIGAAYSFSEISSFAATAAHQIPSGGRAPGGWSLGLPGTLQHNEVLTPLTVGADALTVQAQRSAGAEPDSGHVPAVPEPAGWMLLLSGFAVVACIARRRAGMTQM